MTELSAQLDDTAQAETLALTVVERAGALTVTDAKTYNEAGTILVSIKDAMKRITAYWDEPVKKARAAWEELTKKRGEMLKPMEAAEATLKRDMAAFHAKMEQMKADQERAIRETLEAQAKKDQEALAKENEFLGNGKEAEAIRQAPVYVPPVELPKVQEVDRIKYREDWKAEVTDPLAVPREYLVIDEKKLAAVARALKADAKVPGVRFFPQKVIVAGR